jgi:hypothetical protein
VAEALPAVCGDCAFTLRTVAPERTFWEKVALLHEEAHRTGDVPPKARLARHVGMIVGHRLQRLHDVWRQRAVHRRALTCSRTGIESTQRGVAFTSLPVA